jgi:hypothetical protein
VSKRLGDNRFALMERLLWPYPSPVGFVRIYDDRVEATPHGYRCSASVEVKGKGKPFSFVLVVPPGAYAKIGEGFGRRFGDTDVRSLFEARIKQYVENGVLSNWSVDLGCLDSREVDGLFSDIRRANRLRQGVRTPE